MNVDEMNDDCLDHVFSFLDVKERINILRVCRRWKNLISNQFQRERHLLITPNSEFRDQIHSSPFSIDSMNNFNEPNALNFFYLQNKSSQSNLIRICPSPKKFHKPYALLKLCSSNPHAYELPNSFQFDSLFAKFPKLNSISFHSKKNQSLISSIDLNLIIQRCRSLTKIILTDCKELNSNSLKAIAKIKTLEYLDLTNSRYYGNNGLKCILKSCNRLDTLFIGYNRKLTGLFFKCSIAKLKHLDLTECNNFTNKGMEALAKNFNQSLESLITFPISNDNLLRYVCTNFPNLTKLSFKFNNTNSLDLKILIEQSKFIHLSSLSLDNIDQFNDQTLTNLSINFKQITKLEIKFRPNTTTFQIYLSILELPKNLPNLNKLTLINIALNQNQNQSILKSFVNFNFLDSICISLTNLDERDVVTFVERMFNKRKKLSFFHIEYLQNELKNKQTIASIKHQLNLIEKQGYLVCINQLKLTSRHISQFIYLTKILIKN